MCIGLSTFSTTGNYGNLANQRKHNFYKRWRHGLHHRGPPVKLARVPLPFNPGLFPGAFVCRWAAFKLQNRSIYCCCCWRFQLSLDCWRKQCDVLLRDKPSCPPTPWKEACTRPLWYAGSFTVLKSSCSRTCGLCSQLKSVCDGARPLANNFLMFKSTVFALLSTVA